MSEPATDRHEPLRVTLPVEGMTCAACQANVQRALAASPGVAKAAVNLMTHEATVHYDPAATSPEQLVAAINDTGYVSHLPTAATGREDEERERSQAREYSTLLTKAIASLLLGAVAMIASMPLMGGGGHAEHSGDPLIAWTMRVLDPPMRRMLPGLHALDAAALLFALLVTTTFVMAWAGRHF